MSGAEPMPADLVGLYCAAVRSEAVMAADINTTRLDRFPFVPLLAVFYVGNDLPSKQAPSPQATQARAPPSKA